MAEDYRCISRVQGPSRVLFMCRCQYCGFRYGLSLLGGDEGGVPPWLWPARRGRVGRMMGTCL